MYNEVVITNFALVLVTIGLVYVTYPLYTL